VSVASCQCGSRLLSIVCEASPLCRPGSQGESRTCSLDICRSLRGDLCPESGYRTQPRVSTLIFVQNLSVESPPRPIFLTPTCTHRGHHRCPWKHRSTVRMEHRLEAYATLTPSRRHSRCTSLTDFLPEHELAIAPGMDANRYPPVLASLVVSPDETRSVLNGIAGF
jgi:hypothetical protein